MPLVDRRDEMSLLELAEELELRFPERVSAIERDHPEAWEAALSGNTDELDEELADDLRDDLRSLLRI